MTSEKQADYLLDCFHVGYGTVRVGEKIRCLTCGLGSEVVALLKEYPQYVVKCSGCNYTRYCGTSKEYGKLICSKHFISRGHEMIIKEVKE